MAGEHRQFRDPRYFLQIVVAGVLGEGGDTNGGMEIGD